MNYYEDKVPDQSKVDPTHLGEIYKEWITELQAELKKAGRQVDRLERKLLLRSRKLGDAREGRRQALDDLMNLAVAGIPAGSDFADDRAHERELEFQLAEREREIDYLRSQEDVRW